MVGGSVSSQGPAFACDLSMSGCRVETTMPSLSPGTTPVKKLLDALARLGLLVSSIDTAVRCMRELQGTAP